MFRHPRRSVLVAALAVPAALVAVAGPAADRLIPDDVVGLVENARTHA